MAYWIDSDAKLIGMLDDLGSATVLAVDTEFIRTNTYPLTIDLSLGSLQWNLVLL